ncbi:hypothetical protein J2S43_006756 [Catenuloplanes nepalensis]|uniref:ARC6 IMS domain-containing protein n=1 Tax=Catenuloplanes nepalensis TaxID=587533 RepID=A0ABT9N3G7_9ACTN|nr:hypothetical protein [Catenuloplanes nepalensis]MDP9798244.1 hypothetical protein [Catenuloplanes nepalensis]
MEQSQPDKPTQPPADPATPLDAGPVTPESPRPAKRRRSWRTVLLVIASILGVLCSGTVGYGLWWYNQETKPNRSAPDVVVDNYLRALLVEENPVQRSLYECSEPKGLAAIEGLQRDITNREKMFGVDFQVTWGSLAESGSGSSRQVAVNIRLSAVVDGFPQSDIQSWQLDLLGKDEWRVCGARRLE